MAQGKKPEWYTMDNAGILYSALQREEYSAVYRFSAVLTETVDPEALKRAVGECMPRFPGFAVKVKKGAFWYYFEPNDAPGPPVLPDVSNPCQPMRFTENGGWLIRFYYYEKRVSLEVFHSLSDGAGALVFFRTVLSAYLREVGHDMPYAGQGLLDLREPPLKEEREDAYARYAGRRALRSPMPAKAYQNRGTAERFYTLNVTMGFLPLDKLREVARGLGVTVTEYLTAVLMKVLIDKQRREKPVRERPVALAIPVNLRSWFPSGTLRNFILTLRPCIDPSLGEYAFEDVLNYVHHYLRLEQDKARMRGVFTRNVRFQRSRLLAVIPVFLKNPIMALSYRLAGVRPYSATYTNPGAFQVPHEMRPFIEHMEVILGQATDPRPHAASISYGNVMEITFAGTQREADTEREFFRFLVRSGIPVQISSNRKEAR